MKWTKCKKWNRNSEKLNFKLNLFLSFTINYSWNWEWLCFDQNCVNRTETVHGTLRLFPVFISPIVWNTCEHLHYESVYFKELHKEQEYYLIYRAGAAVVSSITSYMEDITWPHGDTKSLFACWKQGESSLGVETLSGSAVMGLGLELVRLFRFRSGVRGRKWRRLGRGRFGFIALYL